MEATFKVLKVKKYTKGKLLGYATVGVGDVLVLTGIRIIDGPNGKFISMRQRKGREGYQDIYYPMTKPLRAQLQAEVLKAYEALEKAEPRS
jgi:stage V sporulation protein G